MAKKRSKQKLFEAENTNVSEVPSEVLDWTVKGRGGLRFYAENKYGEQMVAEVVLAGPAPRLLFSHGDCGWEHVEIVDPDFDALIRLFTTRLAKGLVRGTTGTPLDDLILDRGEVAWLLSVLIIGSEATAGRHAETDARS